MNVDVLMLNLKKRGFVPYFVENETDANNLFISLVPRSSTIAFGGSQTVEQLSLLPELQKLGYTLYHRSIYTDNDVFQKQRDADFYVSSANAITIGGDIINIDGRSNRVGDIVNGPLNQVFLIGINKIVNSIEEGIDRSRNTAGVMNAKRLNRKTPCTITGKCEYCNSPDTICKSTVILHHPTANRVSFVIIINKNLGF